MLDPFLRSQRQRCYEGGLLRPGASLFLVAARQVFGLLVMWVFFAFLLLEHGIIWERVVVFAFVSYSQHRMIEWHDMMSVSLLVVLAALDSSMHISMALWHFAVRV